MKTATLIITAIVAWPFLVFLTARLFAMGVYSSKIEYLKRIDQEVTHGKKKGN
jgi:hypothetical protein